MGKLEAVEDAPDMRIDAATPARTAQLAQQATRTRRAQLGQDFGYLLAGLPIGIAAFVVAVVGVAAGVGLFVVWLGLPVLVGTLAAARGFARLERWRVQAVTGAALPPHYYRARPSGGGVTRLLRALLEPQSWRDLLHMVLAFLLRVPSFVIAFSWLVGGLGGLLYVLWEWAPPRGPEDHRLYELITGNESWLADVLFMTAVGAILLVTLPFVLRGLTVLQIALARGLLTSETAALRARTEQLADRRRAAVQAEAQTLRRVERDIHDGPQQRLVRLNMDLEAAARRLDDDPEQARPLVAEALAQSREALSELRVVSCGIAPPILADRGSARRWPRRQRAARWRCRWTSHSKVASASPRQWRTPPTSSSPRRSPTSPSTRWRGDAPLPSSGTPSGCTSGSATTAGAVGGPTVLEADIPLAGLDGRG